MFYCLSSPRLYPLTLCLPPFPPAAPKKHRRTEAAVPLPPLPSPPPPPPAPRRSPRRPPARTRSANAFARPVAPSQSLHLRALSCSRSPNLSLAAVLPPPSTASAATSPASRGDAVASLAVSGVQRHAGGFAERPAHALVASRGDRLRYYLGLGYWRAAAFPRSARLALAMTQGAVDARRVSERIASRRHSDGRTRSRGSWGTRSTAWQLPRRRTTATAGARRLARCRWLSYARAARTRLSDRLRT